MYRLRVFLLFICISLSFAFFIQTANAEDGDFIKPYGNLYVFFGYVESARYTAGGDEEKDRDTFYTINDNSNIGFNFTYRQYKGVFELGISDMENDWDVKLRKAYGIFNFGFGELMIGQTWTPYTHWSYESANYYRSEGFGALYDNLTTQAKVTMKFGLYIDIIKPYVGTITYYDNQTVDNPTSDPSFDEYDLVEVEREITTRQPLENIQSLFPKIAVGYDYKSGRINAGLGAAGNIYKIKKTDDVEFNKKWIISYLAYLYSELKFGNFGFNLSGGFSVNPANFGLKVQSAGNSTFAGGAAASVYNIATGKYEIKDTWNIQSYAEFEWAFMKNTVAHLGYGFSLVNYPMQGYKDDYAMEYYLNIKFNLANLIALTPSVSYHDYMKDIDGNKEGSDLYAGILATVSFY
ncbi:MAG: hypothetical protein JW864_16480 [Spirochaetes bacterium]|nr:hypothetical protein [Spirochaetota bacterium]